MKYLVLGAIGTGRSAIAAACVPDSVTIRTERTGRKSNSQFGPRRFAIVSPARIQSFLDSNHAVLVDDYNDTDNDSGYESLDDVTVAKDQHLVVVTHVVPSQQTLLKYDMILIPHARGNEMYFDHLMDLWGLSGDWADITHDTLVFSPPTFGKRTYVSTDLCWEHSRANRSPRPNVEDLCGMYKAHRV